MSILTSPKLDTVSSSRTHRAAQNNLQFSQTSVDSAQKTLQDFDRNVIEVTVSDAETQVIASKARKAGMSVNEYMRHAALGFPLP